MAQKIGIFCFALFHQLPTPTSIRLMNARVVQIVAVAVVVAVVAVVVVVVVVVVVAVVVVVVDNDGIIERIASNHCGGLRRPSMNQTSCYCCSCNWLRQSGTRTVVLTEKHFEESHEGEHVWLLLLLLLLLLPLRLLLIEWCRFV